jgi:hypothetical protein
MSHKFAIMHRTERCNKETVMSVIDCILEPLSNFIEMEADVSTEEVGAYTDITIKFDIRRVR